MGRWIPLVALGVALAVASPAAAATPGLSLARADRAAQHEADATVADWLEIYQYEQEQAPLEAIAPEPDVTFITGYELDACGRTSARRAECDVTYFVSDGSECDDTLIVRTTRKNRVAVASEGMDCGEAPRSAGTEPSPPQRQTS